jgi:hypothetical protein
LRPHHVDSSEVAAVHFEIVVVRLNGVVGDAFFDPEVLEETAYPLFVRHRTAARFTSRNSASSRDRNRWAIAKYVATPAAIVVANAIPFCIVCPA